MMAKVEVRALHLEFPVELPAQGLFTSANEVVTATAQRLREEAVVQFKRWLDRASKEGSSSGLHLVIEFKL
jgi:hypothetical protein